MLFSSCVFPASAVDELRRLPIWESLKLIPVPIMLVNLNLMCCAVYYDSLRL